MIDASGYDRTDERDEVGVRPESAMNEAPCRTDQYLDCHECLDDSYHFQ
jgi:hypothetical protein